MKHLSISIALVEGYNYVAAGSRGKESWDEYTTLDCYVPSQDINITVKYKGKYDATMGNIIKAQFHAKGETWLSGEEIPADYFKLRSFVNKTDKLVSEFKAFNDYRKAAKRELAFTGTLKGK